MRNTVNATIIRKIAHRILVFQSVAKSLLTLAWIYVFQSLIGRRKIVVINLIESMGDIVACLPVADFVKSQDPDCYVVWTVRKPYRELVLSSASVDAALVTNCIHEFKLVNQLGLHHRTINLHLHGRSCHVCNSFIEKPPGFDHITPSNYYNHGTLLEAFSLSSGLPKLGGQPRLVIPSQVMAAVDRLGLPKKLISIHCVASQENRNWPTASWEELVRELAKEYLVVEIGSHPRLENAPTHYLSLCGRLSLIESAEVIRRSALFIGVDSGPAHLANAVQTPGVLLLGKYLEFSNRMPFTGFFADPKNARILSDPEDINHISVSSVLEAALERLSSKVS